jgi:hypothetical protein
LVVVQEQLQLVDQELEGKVMQAEIQTALHHTLEVVVVALDHLAVTQQELKALVAKAVMDLLTALVE